VMIKVNPSLSPPNISYFVLYFVFRAPCFMFHISLYYIPSVI
jgi:hypothetical protein